MIVFRSAKIAALSVAVGASAVHADSFKAPSGCQLEMTVQLRQCTVANHYTCAANPGERWIAYADGEGQFFTSRIDAETRWLQSISHDTGEVDLLDEGGSADHASFSALLATGRDDYDFVTESNSGQRIRYRGYDRLTGETVTVDGVPLERCEFDLSAYDAEGNLLSRRSGLQLVSRDMRLFFADTETFEAATGETATTSQPPVIFAFPGDEGFGALDPVLDCDVLMSGTPAPVRPTL